MGMFDQVAAAQLKALFLLLVLGNVFRLIPDNTVEACGTDLYVRFVLTRQLLLLTATFAALLLLNVRARSRTAARLGLVAAGCKRRLLRGMLLLAVALSFAASVLAVLAFQDGFLYRTRCDAAYLAGHGAGSPMSVLIRGGATQRYPDAQAPGSK